MTKGSLPSSRSEHRPTAAKVEQVEIESKNVLETSFGGDAPEIQNDPEEKDRPVRTRNERVTETRDTTALERSTAAQRRTVIDSHPPRIQIDSWRKQELADLEARRAVRAEERSKSRGYTSSNMKESELSANKRQDLTSSTRTQNFLTESSIRRYNETLQLKALDDSSPKKLSQYENLQGTSKNSYLVTRYQALKQQQPRIRKETLKFAYERIDPPLCLLDALDALFSLLVGVWDRLEPDYFNILHKKYQHYKTYLRNIDDLHFILKSLRSRLESEGLPSENILMADKALCRYKKSIKQLENRSYSEQTNEIYHFVYYFLEYFNLLRVTSTHPETQLGTTASN